MTFDSQYARMLFPMPVRVWGRRLQPVTVGHYALLSRVEAAIASGDQIPGPGDLALCLWILSRPWRKAEKQLGTRRQIWACRLMAWALRNSRELHKQALSEFLAYWSFQNETFEIWKESNGGDSDEERVPLMQMVRWMLISEWGYTHTEAMDIPWKLAVSDAFGCLAIKEKVQIVTPKSKARREYLDQILKERSYAG